MRSVVSLAFVLALAAAGCSKDEPKPAVPSTGSAPAASGLDKLSDADRKLAEAQGVCPVSGEALGSMGKPVRIEYQGTVLFLCCGQCKSKFDAEPARYIAKLKK